MIKNFTCFLVSLFFYFSSYAQNGKGTIKGRILSADSLPASFVPIGLKGTKFGTSTNEKGEYELKAPVGKHILKVQFVGHEPEEKEIKIADGETVVEDFSLRENLKELQEVVVQGNVNLFAQKESDYIARLPLKNIENPQVYSVVTKELLKQQVVTSINSALVNTPGAAPANYPAGGFAITSRGFLTGINARNGMETVASRSSVDIGNVERIEVLKGPSGTLFGASVSSFGGVINLVTKRPYETLGGEFTYTFGSFGQNRFALDVNTPLDKEKRALVRLNAVVIRQNSFLDYGYNNSILVAPSFSYKLTDKLTLLADAEFLHIDQTRITYTRVGPSSGIDNPSQLGLPFNKSLYASDANALTSSNKYFLEAKYKLARNWTSSTLFSFVSENVKQSYQYYPTYINPNLVARNILIYGPIYNNYTNLQENINGTFITGFLKHNLNVGINYRYFNGSFTYVSSGTKFIDTVNANGNFTALNKSKIDQFMLSKGAVLPSLIASQQTYSAYATDVLSFTKRLSLLISLRLDRYNYNGIGTTAPYQQTALVPKIGLVYQIMKDQLSVFGNYMSGFQNVAPITLPDGNMLVPQPVFANQMEAGIKAELFNKKVQFMASYYQIAVDNAIRVENGFSIQDGKQLSKGAEVELIANPIRGLNLVLGYGFNDNRIVRATTKSTEGNKAASAPENVANGWISYSLTTTTLKGLGIGLGFNYVDKAYLDATNAYYLPEYKMFGATAFYDQPRWRIGFKANNVTNERYWDLYGAPQPTSHYSCSLALKF